ncbi:hypothetical protein Hanom_Chr05g00397021 [Helianthus anomalus]
MLKADVNHINDGGEMDIELGEFRVDDQGGASNVVVEDNVNVESNLNEVHVNLNKGSDRGIDKGGVSTSQKKYKKKPLFKNRVVSPGSQERPKKRARENSDIFGLDKLIGIINSSSSGNETSEEEASISVGFCTPDLNKSCGSTAVSSLPGE